MAPAVTSLVGREGLEPSSLTALELKSSEFANFSTCPLAKPITWPPEHLAIGKMF